MAKRLVHMLVVLTLLLPLTGPAAAQEAEPVPPGPTVGLSLVADGLTAPLSLVVPDDGTGRRFVVDQTGQIRIITRGGTMLAEPFLDVADRMVPVGPGFTERGLLGLAFHPDYADNGRFFVYYSAPRRPEAPTNWNHTSHISEFRVSADNPNRADHDSERIVLQVDQPQSNHNAGDLLFGPDGLLYITLGDGGGANDTGVGHTPGIGNGQDVTNLLGSLLRIDVDTGDPYGIPADNPLVGREGRDEIFAYGLRNPFRMAFDGDDLFVADVGQGLWEEVNIIERGGNHGWNIKEGTHCFDPQNPLVVPDSCPDTGLFGEPLIDPVIEYPHIRQPGGIGIAVIGGFVYRGTNLPGLHGRYVFGDWSTAFAQPDGTLLTAQPRGPGLWHVRELQVAGRPDGRLGEFVRGFGMDGTGELYLLTNESTGPTGTSGKVYRLVHPTRPAVGGTQRNFVAPLTGEEEVPPVDTRATGLATFQVNQDGTAIAYRLNVANIQNVTQAHIHVGAFGVNGPVTVWLYPPAPPAMLIPGRSSGELATGTITEADLVGPLAGESLGELLDLMAAGQTYVNVHTSQFPGGEIRGQIRGGPRAGG